MAEAEGTQRIVKTLMTEPHIEGRRISVLQIRERVEESDLRPDTVADQYNLDRADVYHALAYYHEHPREMQQVRNERKQAYEELLSEIERPAGVDPTDHPENEDGSASQPHRK